MNEVKHSPGAIRAARIIAGESYPSARTIAGIADLIDRETAASALLEACKASERTYASLERNCELITDCLQSHGLPSSWLHLEINKAAKLRAAIAQATGEEVPT